jgi:hypothetical protein
MCDQKYDEKSVSEFADISGPTCLIDKINDDVVTDIIMPFFQLTEIFCILALVCKKFEEIIPQVTHNKIRIGKKYKWHLIKLNVNTVKFYDMSVYKTTVQNIGKLLNVKEALEFHDCIFNEEYDSSELDILSNVRSLRISECDHFDMPFMKNLKYSKIQKLNIDSNYFTSEIIDCVLDMKELETLTIGLPIYAENQLMLDDNHIVKMSKMTKLKNLRISGFDFSNCDTHALRSLRLNKLRVDCCISSEKIVFNLISPSLEELELFDLDITNDLIMHMSHLEKQNLLKLTHLLIHCCPGITNKSLEYLNDLNLSSLKLYHNNIDDLSSLHIPRLSGLMFHSDSDQISEEKFQNLFDMPLKHLEIFKKVKKLSDKSKDVIRSTTLKNISEKCRTLKKLSLHGINIDINDVIEHLSGMNFDRLSLHNDLGMKYESPERFAKIDQLVRANVIKNHKSFNCGYYSE